MTDSNVKVYRNALYAEKRINVLMCGWVCGNGVSLVSSSTISKTLKSL